MDFDDPPHNSFTPTSQYTHDKLSCMTGFYVVGPCMFYYVCSIMYVGPCCCIHYVGIMLLETNGKQLKISRKIKKELQSI